MKVMRVTEVNRWCSGGDGDMCGRAVGGVVWCGVMVVVTAGHGKSQATTHHPTSDWAEL
jgi:hypothetical protein